MCRPDLVQVKVGKCNLSFDSGRALVERFFHRQHDLFGLFADRELQDLAAGCSRPSLSVEAHVEKTEVRYSFSFTGVNSKEELFNGGLDALKEWERELWTRLIAKVEAAQVSETPEGFFLELAKTDGGDGYRVRVGGRILNFGEKHLRETDAWVRLILQEKAPWAVGLRDIVRLSRGFLRRR